MRYLLKILHHTGGATAIEYALIMVGISLATMGATFTFGGDLSEFFVDMGSHADTAAENLTEITIE
jgi:Flp pilus assembly pilin Flp